MRASHSIEDQWLEKVIVPPLASTLKELVDGTRTDCPDRLQEAIDLISDALDKLSARRTELDEMETERAVA